MARTHMAVLVGFTLAAGACNESATRPSDPDPSGGPAFVVGEEAATGARASGHEALIFVGDAIEKSSFIALSTAPSPTAKGEFEYHATTHDLTAELHGDVDCLVIVNNEATLSGPVERYVVNGVPVPAHQFYLRVQDNSEGENYPDRASPLFVLGPPNFPFPVPDLCESEGPNPLLPTQEGNIQVQPE